MLRRVLSFILVFALAFNFLSFGVFAAGTDSQLFCPNCNSFQPQGVVTAHSYCPKCGCSLMSLGGGGSRGGGAGRRDIPKKYYTQGSGNDGKYSVSSGSTLYYSIDNTVNKTLNFTSYLDGTVPEDNENATDWQNMVYRWTDCPVLTSLNLGTYTGYTLMDESTGNNQDVLGKLYIGCRGTWTEKSEEAYAADDVLWQKLTEGAVSTAGQE